MSSNTNVEEIDYCLKELPMEFSKNIDNLVKADDIIKCKQHYRKLKEIIENHVSLKHLETKGYEKIIRDAYRFMGEYIAEWIKDRTIARDAQKGDALLKLLGLLGEKTSDFYIKDGYISAVESLSFISKEHKIIKKELNEMITEDIWAQRFAQKNPERFR